MIITEQSTRAARTWLRYVSLAGGLIVVLLGACVMLGWHLGSHWLIQIRSSFVPIQYNAGLAFLVSGAGVLWLVFDRPKWATGAGLAVAAVGGLTLLQDLVSIWAPRFSLGIDQLLMEHKILTSADAPGRMAPNTALCFLLVGSCLAVRPTQRWFIGQAPFAALTASTAFGLGMVAISGYYVQLPPAYGWGDWTEMSVHASIGFALLSASLLLLQWRRDICCETWVPRWVPLTIAIAVMTATLCFAQALHAEGVRLHEQFPERGHFTRVTHLAALVLVIGTVLAVALAAVAHLSQKAYSRAWQLHQANLSLWAEIATRKEAERALAAHRDNLELAVAQRTRELESARREAEEANRAKSDFLSHMSHELRTPLNGVLGYAQILQRNAALTPEARQQLDAIVDCGDHLLSLINDVLDLAKIEAKKVELDLAPVPLAALVHSVTGIVRERARRKGLALNVQLAADVPAAIVTDGAKLRQILINLLGNAIKFTPRGAVDLRVAQAPAGTLRFAVSDTGIGMSADEIREIFDPFKQVEAGKAAGGTGLGLAITKNLADLLGATVAVDSSPGAGSTFTVTMPLVAASADELQSMSDAAAATDSRVALPPDQTCTLLIADDREVNRQVLVGLLKPVGFRLLVASDGAEALALLRDHPEVALVLMDLRMPRVSGTAALEQIRQDPALRETKVIAVSASAFPTLRQQLLAAGFDDFIAKPFRWDELLAALRRHLDLPLVTVEGGAESSAPAAAAESALAVEPGGGLTESQLEQFRGALRIKNVTAIKSLGAELETAAGTRELGQHLRALARQFAFSELAALLHELESDHDLG